MAKKKIGYGDFYCVFCGEGIEKKADACPRCGKPYGDGKFNGIELLGAGGIGWSEQADNPCFRRREKKNLFGMIIIMMIISVIIFSVIYFTSDMEFDEVLPIFGGVMAIEWIFWIIWLIGQYGRRKSWEGVVERKEHYQQTVTRKDEEGYRYTQTQMIYKVHFRKNNGKRKTLTAIDHSEWYDYLSEGDRVRYHGKNMNYYEKYDKSRDKFIPCASCGSARDPREVYCGKCGCILLKAPRPVSPQEAFLEHRPANGEVPYAIPVSKKTPAQNEVPYAIPVTKPTEQKEQKAVHNPTPKFCPNCGAKASGGGFCSECGTRF